MRNQPSRFSQSIRNIRSLAQYTVMIAAFQFLGTANGQQVEFTKQYNTRHLQQEPRLGWKLKNVSAFDSDGKEFQLSALRGKYSVLVFGCLT